MPYRCNVSLVSTCKLNASLRNLTSNIHINSGDNSKSRAGAFCPRIRAEANVFILFGMDSTYYHNQCVRRNGWIRGSSAPQLQTLMTTMTTSPVPGGHQYRAMLHHDASSNDERTSERSNARAGSSTDRSQSLDADRSSEYSSEQHRRGFSSFWNSRSNSLDNGVRFNSSEPNAPWSHYCVNQPAAQPDFFSVRELRATLNRVRQWKFTEAGLAHLRNQRGRQAQNAHIEFSVASYNVLAQCLLEENVGHLYPYCPSEYLSWENRRRKLMDEFCRTDADVLCLQEVQCDHYDTFFVPQLAKLGYKGLYKKRTGGKKDGCAIFFRDSLFELDRSALIEYHRPGMPILNRDNVALVAVLRAKHSSKQGGEDADVEKDDHKRRLCVANTHLLFNPSRGDIRLAQMRILFAELDRMAFQCLKPSSKSSGYHPIIVCGDMNSRPHCHLYKFISTGSLDYEGLAAGDISGCESKRKLPKRGRTCLEKEFVPAELGITDRCQYVEVSDSRRQSDCDPPTPSEVLFSSGQMTHGLNLVSVYGHRIDDDQPEVTTHHDRASCTVDYIFYSVENKRSEFRDDRVVHERIDEGRLNLLATYALPSSDELRSIGGLPNAVLASDHVQLVAKFLLKTD